MHPALLALSLLLLGCGGSAADDGPASAGPAFSASQGDVRVQSALAEALSGSGIPGGVAGIFRQGEPPVIGAFGLRKAGSDVPFGASDLVHIGSDTKAMTAALVARLVDQGRLDWDSTLADGLPEVAAKIHGNFRDVTVLELLRHTGGVPENAANWRAFPGKPVGERRRLIAKASLGAAPVHPPGEGFLYSNLGVMLVGTMAAASAGGTWEDLMRTEVFGPLGMASAGFGAPGTPGEIDQPWGHVAGTRGAARGLQTDNDPALGPAGTVHLTLEDWGRFVLQFTERAAAESEYLSPASRRRLVEAGPTGYACGWSVAQRGWAGGTALSHAGSNTMWYAVAWVAPAKNRAFLVAVNAAPKDAAERVDRVVSQLIELDASIPEREATAEAPGKAPGATDR